MDYNYSTYTWMEVASSCPCQELGAVQAVTSFGMVLVEAFADQVQDGGPHCLEHCENTSLDFGSYPSQLQHSLAGLWQRIVYPVMQFEHKNTMHAVKHLLFLVWVSCIHVAYLFNTNF